MLYPLEPGPASPALPLLEGKDHLLLLEAVVTGSAPGYLRADDPDRPRALFASGPEGHYLLGDPHCTQFAQAVLGDIRGRILPRARELGWGSLTLNHEPGWETVVEALASPDASHAPVPVHTHQRYFRWTGPPLPPELPEGVTVHAVDEALLARTDLDGVDRLRDFATGDYESQDAFLAQGYGQCLVRDGELLSWCTTDCVVGRRAEIGIMTRPAYRRQGYGVLAARAMLAESARRGIERVGWHCFAQNLGSAATALKAGFVEGAPHAVLALWLNPVDGHLVNANLALMRGDYDEADRRYRVALAPGYAPDAESRCLLLSRAEDRTRYRYLAACAAALAGDRAGAADLLEQALASGSYRQAGY